MKKVLVSMLPIILLFGIWGKSAKAQSSGTPEPAAKFAGWDVSKKNSPDITVTAVIQQVIPNHASGIPAGLHLMLGTPQGVVDASVGQFLPQHIQQALTTGQLVQVTGRIQTIHNQNYLLARALVVDGNTITVRNDHGSLVHAKSSERVHTQTLQNNQNGGRQ